MFHCIIGVCWYINVSWQICKKKKKKIEKLKILGGIENKNPGGHINIIYDVYVLHKFYLNKF